MAFRLIIAALLFSSPCFAQIPSVRDLNVLIGTWEVEETHPSGWSEKGVRSCYYIMDSTYIECETKAVSNNKRRTYRFLINYNLVDKQFEMVGIYSNWSLKQYDILIPESAGKKFRITNSSTIASDTQREATIEFNTNDTYTWSGKNFNPKKNTTTIYTEKGVRKAPK